MSDLYICDHAETCRSRESVWCSKPFIVSCIGSNNEYIDGHCKLHGVDKPFVRRIPYNKPNPEYKLLKPIDIGKLYQEGACSRELHKFAFLVVQRYFDHDATVLWNHPLTLECVVTVASQCEGGIEWLIMKGFIAEKKEEVFYHVGQRFKDAYGTDAVLAQTNNYMVALIMLPTGNRYNNPINVINPTRITQEEFMRISCNNDCKWTLID